jgi:hypothetical protein
LTSEKSLTVAFAALAAVLALTGCGGSSSGTKAAGTLPVASQSASASTGSVAGSATTGSSPTGVSATGGTMSPVPASTAGSTNPPASPRAVGKPPGKPTGFTRAGTYTYEISGTTKQPLGGNQRISGSDTDTYDPPQGSIQHNKETGQQGSSEMTLQVKSSGLYVVDLHISQQGFDEDFHPVATAKYFPASYPTGTSWSWEAKSTDNKYTLHVTSKISGSSSVTVGGKALKAVIVDSTLHITGNGVDLNVQQRDWVSTTYALVLKEHSTSNGTAFGASFTSSVTRQLRSTTPS